MIGMASAFSEKITSPIYAMMREMEKIEIGKFKVDIPVTSTDEIGVLSNRFNRMSRELQQYINRSYVAEIKEKEAELIALKSQIHPHFLYNTLEVIRMTALDESDEKTAKMIEVLSDQMRYIIGEARDIVPLQMEVDVIHKYIYLINCRYDGKVIFEVEANNLMNVMIPKLILQPIVENAFFHGLRPNQGEGTIQLTVEERDEKIVITIMDNGVGMKKKEQEKLEELLASDRPGNKEEYSWRSIGLKNVHDRLYYLYGEQYGITIISHENVGTAICVSVPKHMEEVRCGL
jgi:two-component system sensor histidine kinase YesM